MTETRELKNVVIFNQTTIALRLKYLRNFWRSLEMLLINCKVELKLKWRKYGILYGNGNDNDNANVNNIIFSFKDTKLYVPVYQQEANISFEKLLAKDFRGSWNEYITKSENKNITNE